MMYHVVVDVNKKGRSKDFIVMKFDYGVKGGISAKELRDYYYEKGAEMTIVPRKPGNAGRGKGRCQIALSWEISAFAQEKEKQMQTKNDRIRELSQRQQFKHKARSRMREICTSGICGRLIFCKGYLLPDY